MDLLGRAKRYLSGEPTADLGPIAVVSSLLGVVMGTSFALMAAYVWFRGDPGTPLRTYLVCVLLAVSSSFIAQGLAGLLPARWRAGIAALRAVHLMLLVALVVVFVLIFGSDS